VTALNDDALQASIFSEHARQRLVRLCAVITGEPDAADDLAQETFLEAWRHLERLSDPSGFDRWLAAIARNVCRRWVRRRGQELVVTTAASESVEDVVDLEAELERAELIELLDRALAMLPAETRDVLIQRFVLDLPHAAIADRLGLSTDAVSMRISRGKTVLRRLLTTELREEAGAYGLVGAPADEWRPTRVWCRDCGEQTLLLRREASPGVIALRCPRCDTDMSSVRSEFRLGNPFFTTLLGAVTRPTAIIARTRGWAFDYFAGGLTSDGVPCTRCARPVPLRRYVRGDLAGQSQSHGLLASCGHCGEEVSCSLAGMSLSRPEVRRFCSEHRRSRRLPDRWTEHHGRAALVVSYRAVTNTCGMDVLFAADTLDVLDVVTATA